jgi:hypothetical protein
VLDRAGIPRYARVFPHNHTQLELQVHLTQAYLKALEAPRHYALRPTLETLAGSQTGLTAAVEASGGKLGQLRQMAWYTWNFTDPIGDHAGFALVHPFGAWWNGEAYLKYHREQHRLSPGLAAVWTHSPQTRAALSVEQAPAGPRPRWQAEFTQNLPLTERLTVNLRLLGGRQATGDLPGGPPPGRRGDSDFGAAMAGCTYSLNPNGWPVWGVALAYPHLIAQAERVSWRAPGPGEPGAPGSDTWLRAGAALDLKFFGFVPLRLTFLAGTAVPSGRANWSLSFGRTLRLH